MAEVIVAGAGICGMASALMLARDGHDVLVIDRDDAPTPADVESAWASWRRRSVGQFRFAHLMLARGTQVLSSELPDVVDRLEQHGGLRWNVVATVMAGAGSGAPQPEDSRLDMVTGRRPTIEWVLAGMCDVEPRVTVRRGAAIAGLVPGREAIPGVPHVVGVQLESGERVTGDLVVDATGRRSPTVRWTEALATRPPDEQGEDSGFAYYGRFFRSPDGSVPPMLAPGLTPFGSMSVLTIPSDNGTWSITLYGTSDDAPMRRLRQAEVFERVVRACPAHAHWLDGEPISEVASMTGVVDRIRTFVVDGTPVVTGMLSVADAWACTNPSLGRGMSIGLLHAALMRRTVASHLDDPARLALAFHDATRTELEPWHAATRDTDRLRLHEMRAIIAGEEPADDPRRSVSAALASSVPVDPVALRAYAELQGCLALPHEVFGRPGLLDHVVSVAEHGSPPPPGPDRVELLELLS